MSANTFLLRTIGLCTAVALVAAGLAAASTLQPPRLSGIEYSGAALIESGDARLVFRLNQSVEELNPADVSVKPELPVTTTTDGATVTVRLGARLDYRSELRLKLRVVSRATGVATEIEETLRAPDIRVRTLVRDDRGDRIISNDLVSGSAPAEINTQRRVQEYAALGDRIFTVVDTRGGTVEFGEFGGTDRVYTPLIPASNGQLGQLRTDETGQFVGLVADGVELAGRTTVSELLLIDARSGVAPPMTVSGANSRPFAVADWRFVSGGLAVVLRTTADELWLAAPSLGRDAVPLGQAQQIVGVLPDTGEAVVVRRGETVALDVSELVAGGARADTTGTSAERLLGTRDPDRTHLGGDVSVVRSADGHRLLAEHVSSAAELFAPAGAASRIGAVCASPNGAVIAVEVISVDAVSDRRPVRPAFQGTTTAYLDARTGTQLRSTIGFDPDWC